MNLHALTQRLDTGTAHALRVFGRDGRVERISFGKLAADVRALERELASAGIGDRSLVGIVGPNSYAWVVADLALLGLRSVAVCIPEQLSRDATLEELAERYGLEAVLLSEAPNAGRELPAFCAVIERGARDLARRTPKAGGASFGSDVLSLVFSSGTTGSPKCLMVSKAGLENTIRVTAGAWQVRRDDDIFITLPFSNLQQRWMLYMAIWFGFDVSLAPPEKLYRALRATSPTILLGPPAFFEEGERRHLAKPARYRSLRGLLARAARGLPPTWRTAVCRRLFPEIHAMFGGRCRLMLVGSAPTRPALLETFRLLGLPLYEVYGLTEFGWITFNLPEHHAIGSVGRPVEGVRIRFDEQRQVIVEGTRLQTLGYALGSEAEQRAVYLMPGCVATGDTGSLDESGFLRLDGRLKNVIATRGGLKLNPESIEAKLEKVRGVSRAVIFGGGELPALVCVAFAEAAEDDRAAAQISAAIAEESRRFAEHERIGRVVVRPASALTEASGMLTRNLKLNRPKILEVYRDALG